MAYNLDKKLKEFEFERKQVLHHLALLDANIATLKRAIELTQQESDVALYNTNNFVYRSKYKLFKGKIRKYIVQMMREAPIKPLQLPNSRNAFSILNKILIHRPKNILIPFVNN